jgi:hypothetical protein
MTVCVLFALTGCASNSDYVLTPNPTPYYDQANLTAQVARKIK